jgi:hypothetical protein
MEPSQSVLATAPGHSGTAPTGITAYKLTIFLSAYLLFAVQLVLGKYLLPWFGGTPTMWTTCMFFFQILLLSGYAYAHALANGLSLRAQGAWHSALLSASFLLLLFLALAWPSPIMPDASWKPHNSDHPIRSLITLLAVSAGLPYFVLSSTGPLLQSWFARTYPGRTPYRLYALSNLGSFLALLSYPFLVEPRLALKTQAHLWGLGFLAYLAACGYCALRARRSATPGTASLGRGAPITAVPDCVPVTKPSLGVSALWLTLAACASVMFLATTNQICQDIAVIPLLWVLPLSLYLMSFVICFDNPKWYSRRVFHPALGLALFLACFILYQGALTRIVVQVVIYSLVLFTCCMVCHGELARLKPGARYLTRFYLVVATGGALGGVFVALIVPQLFKAFWEYQLGLWGTVLLIFWALMRDKSSWLYCSRFGLPLVAAAAALLPGGTALATGGWKNLPTVIPALLVLAAVYLLARRGQTGFDRNRARAVPLYCATALAVLGATLFFSAWGGRKGTLLRSRNFYGALSVSEQNPNQPDWQAYALTHGRISHGFEFRSAAKRNLPTGYYGLSSGVGRALVALRERSPQPGDPVSLRVGVVGLGVGSLAAYARPGDRFRFYEINPEVIRIAKDRRYFSYLTDCPATLDVIDGDARLSMEEELRRNEPQRFDLLAIDAFTGDAIPVHLLTEEAFRIYLNEIRQPNGVLAVHVTNTYLDLKPLLARVAEHFGLGYAWLHSEGDGRISAYNDWVLLSRDTEFLKSLPGMGPDASKELRLHAVRLWTDDYSNLLQVLKR